MIRSYDKKYLKIALPAALEGLFMILLASADLIMVGTLGAVSIAAVSIFLQPRLVILCFTRSLASSVTLLVSRDAGRNDRTNASDILKKSIFIGAIVLLFIHSIFYLFLEDIFYLMGAKTEYMAEALAYGNIALLSVFISSFTLFFQAVQLGFGQTAIIMKTNILGNIVNVIMNFILIFGMGPIPAMGVAGAAIGTVISTIFSLCWTIYLMKKDHLLEGGSFIPDQAYFKKVTPIFLSVFSEQGFERIGMVLFTRMAASLGTIPFAVHSICMNIADIYCRETYHALQHHYIGKFISTHDVLYHYRIVNSIQVIANLIRRIQLQCIWETALAHIFYICLRKMIRTTDTFRILLERQRKHRNLYIPARQECSYLARKHVGIRTRHI